MTKSLLLEIGLEEIPAKYVTSSQEQLKTRVLNFLTENHLSFGQVKAYSTPRRLAVIVEDLAQCQDDVVEVFKGPALKIAQNDNKEWTKAAIGFVQGKGLDVSDIYIENVNDVPYIHAKKVTTGQPTQAILQQLPQVITQMTFPVSMTWGKHHLKFIRPIHTLICQFGEETIPFAILDVKTDVISRGHRFLGKDTTIQSADHYVEALLGQQVIVDPVERKAKIVSQIQAIAQNMNWIVQIDEDLLEEVTNIVEYPCAFYGKFDEKYLVIPDEVLITTMKEHQRYFEVKDQNGQLLPYFISVRNGNEDFIENVAKGNEKVLVARLEDALFFSNEDAKLTIPQALEKLASVNFHAKIGSMTQKMANTKQIVEVLGEALDLDVTDARSASEFYKFDLVTQMVGEFPELQGVIGEKYALQQGVKPAVAQAIKEHYWPISSEGQLPQSQAGALLAVADKIDTTISFFKVGLIPSGSNDPYALRRSAIGVVRILQENNWGLDLDELFSLLLNDVYNVAYAEQNDLLEALHQFMSARLVQQLQNDHIRHDIIQAALNIDVFSVPFIMENAKEIQQFANQESFKSVIEALNRVVNLFDKSFEIAFDLVPFDPKLSQTNSEMALYQQIEQIEHVSFDTFVQLTPFITAFFEDNMVFVDDVTIRNNRLCLISDLANLILYYMDPTKIIK